MPAALDTAITRRSAFAAAAIACWGGAAWASADSALLGKVGPDFALPGLDGQPIALSGLRGSVVWLDFWASWCGPCARSFPWMQSVQARWKPQGLRVVAVNLDRRTEDALAFMRRFGADGLTVVFDPKAQSAQNYQVKAMPTSFLVDRQGVVRLAHTGFKESDALPLESQLREVLAK